MLQPHRSTLVYVTAVAAVLALLQLSPENWHSLMRYERNGVANGEFWRILTGNFIHLGWGHLALNLSGLLLVGWLFGGRQSPLEWLVALLVSSLSTGLGLYWFSPQITWCVGLSGALHGLMVVGAIDWIRAGDRLGFLLLLGLGGKLVAEQLYGGSGLSEQITGSAIVTDAHVWGAAGGLIFASLLTIWPRALSGKLPQV